MASEPKLVVALEARVKDFERQLARANKVAESNFGKVEKRGKQMADRLEKDMSGAAARIGGVFKTFGAGLVGGLAAGGVAGIVSQFGQVAESVARIGDEASRAGVSARVFQEWAIVAEQARIPVDALTDGLKELSLRGDEFAITGKGSAAEAFTRLGYGAEELKKKLADPSALLLEIIDRLGKFDKAAQIRISDELFGGTAAERFGTLIDQGADSIRATIDQAHRLGNVLDDDVIARAAEVDRQFRIVSQTVGTALKGAIVDAATALQGFIDSFRQFENQQSASLSSKLAEIGAQSLDLENKILKLRGQQADGGLFSRDVTGDIQYLEAERAALQETEAQILAVIEARQKAAAPPAPVPGATFTPAPYTPPPATGGGTKRDTGAASADREAEAVRRLIAELERELSLVGATDLERETSNALRQAGAAATDEQRAKIIALVAALHAEEEATRKATEASEELAAIGKDVLGGIISDLREGKSAADILASALDKVADKLANIALDGLFNGGGGLLSGIAKIFGFAGGGYTGNGGRNQPAGIVHRGEYVFSKAATQRIGVGNLEKLHRGYATGGLVAPPVSSALYNVSGPRPVAASRDVIDINLTDDSGRMANIADRQIRTRSGAIVRIAVQQSQKATRANMPGFLAETQMRTM